MSYEITPRITEKFHFITKISIPILYFNVNHASRILNPAFFNGHDAFKWILGGIIKINLNFVNNEYTLFISAPLCCWATDSSLHSDLCCLLLYDAKISLLLNFFQKFQFLFQFSSKNGVLYVYRLYRHRQYRVSYCCNYWQFSC